MADNTTTTANKELVREFIDRVFNEHNAEATESISARMFGGTEEPWEQSRDPTP
jgi:hypothetical protein